MPTLTSILLLIDTVCIIPPWLLASPRCYTDGNFSLLVLSELALRYAFNTDDGAGSVFSFDPLIDPCDSVEFQSNFNFQVSIDIDNKNGWKECFEVRGIKLPIGYYFGASAATGQLADNHDIISMKLYELDSPEGQQEYWGLPSAEIYEAPRARVEDVRSSMSGWKIFLIIILAIIGLGVCGVVGYLIFNKNNDYSRKRFY